MRYRPEITGLRTIAVIPVVLDHLNIKLFSGGFVGVDVFYVISGFLITSILLNDVSENKFSLARFYERRARRILPALMFTLILTCILAWIILFPADFAAFGKSVAATVGFVSNFLFYSEVSYFAAEAETKPLLHTWSLAIEEQFYILFPLILFVLFKFGKKYLGLWLTLLAVASLAFAIWQVQANTEAAFYLLPARGWELLLGALLAVQDKYRPFSIPRWLAHLLGVAGLAFILAPIFIYTGKTPFPGLAALPVCLGTALIIFSNGNRLNLSGRVLSLKPFVGIGLISYSLYLIHWPVVAFYVYVSCVSLADPLMQAILLALMLVLSVISYYFVETPFRKRKLFAHRKPLFVFAISAIVLSASFGFCLYKMEGIPSRMSEQVITYSEGAIEFNPRRHQCHFSTFASITKQGLCQVGPRHQSDNPLFLSWGDSHMDSFMPLLEDFAKREGITGLHGTFSACAPIVSEVKPQKIHHLACYNFNNYVMKIIRTQNIRHVIMNGAWTSYAGPAKRYLEKTITRITDQGADVWIIMPRPILPYPAPRWLAMRERLGLSKSGGGVSLQKYNKQTKFVKQLITSIASLNNKVHLIDIAELFFRKGNESIIEANGRALYRERSHINTSGAFWLAPAFEELFETLKRDSQINRETET